MCLKQVEQFFWGLGGGLARVFWGLLARWGAAKKELSQKKLKPAPPQKPLNKICTMGKNCTICTPSKTISSQECKTDQISSAFRQIGMEIAHRTSFTN